MNAARRLIFRSSPALVEMESFELPDLQANQILVENTCTQVSAGSEANFLRFGPQSYGLPHGTERANIGYMAVGRIVAAGREVKDFRIGDRVTTGTGHASHSLVEVTPSAAIDLVPDGVSDEVAGFASLGDVALHGVRRAALQIDQSVMVFGLGIVGQLVLQLARISGAHPLIAVDLMNERLDLAVKNGAQATINPTERDPVLAIRELTRGAGADSVFHCAQAASILQTAMECAADRGSVVLTGSPPGTANIRLKEELLRKELRITGTYETGMNQPHPYWPWSRSRNRRACLRLMAEGSLRVEPLLTHVLPAEKAPEMYQTMLKDSRGWLGIVYRWK